MVGVKDLPGWPRRVDICVDGAFLFFRFNTGEAAMARLRWCVGFATVLALLCGASGQARADLTTLSASSDGFLSNGAVSDNGNTLFNNYIAAFRGGVTCLIDTQRCIINRLSTNNKS